jgi:hypothetical protein
LHASVRTLVGVSTTHTEHVPTTRVFADSNGSRALRRNPERFRSAADL